MPPYTPPPPRLPPPPPPLPPLRPLLPTQIVPAPLPPPLRPTPTPISRPSPAPSHTTPRSKSPSESPPMPPPLPPFLLAQFCGSAPQDLFFPNCAPCRTFTHHTSHTEDTLSTDTTERSAESLGVAQWFAARLFLALQQQKKDGEARRERIKDMSRHLNQLKARVDSNKQ